MGLMIHLMGCISENFQFGTRRGNPATPGSKLKVFRNNFKIVCHPICNRVYNKTNYLTGKELGSSHIYTKNKTCKWIGGKCGNFTYKCFLSPKKIAYMGKSLRMHSREMRGDCWRAFQRYNFDTYYQMRH